MLPDRATTTSLHRVRIAAALGAAGFLLAACGSSSSSSTPPPSAAAATSPAAQTSAAAGSAAPSTPVSAPAINAGSGGSFCQYARAQKAQQASEIQAFTTDTPQQLAQLETKALSELTVLTASAPSQIKSAVQTVVGEDQALFDALKKANYDFTKLPPSATAALNNPAFAKANQTIANYLKTSCGISSSSTP
jgi:uncharacterized protein HemX